MAGRILNMLVILLLLITTTGFSVSRHYCGTTLVSVTIDKEVASCCGDSGSNCCHNETKYFQVEDDYLFSAHQFNFENSFSFCLYSCEIPFSVATIGEKTDDLIVYNESPPPPLIQTTLSSLQTYLL